MSMSMTVVTGYGVVFKAVVHGDPTYQYGVAVVNVPEYDAEEGNPFPWGWDDRDLHRWWKEKGFGACPVTVGQWCGPDAELHPLVLKETYATGFCGATMVGTGAEAGRLFAEMKAFLAAAGLDAPDHAIGWLAVADYSR